MAKQRLREEAQDESARTTPGRRQHEGSRLALIGLRSGKEPIERSLAARDSAALAWGLRIADDNLQLVALIEVMHQFRATDVTRLDDAAQTTRGLMQDLRRLCPSPSFDENRKMRNRLALAQLKAEGLRHAAAIAEAGETTEGTASLEFATASWEFAQACEELIQWMEQHVMQSTGRLPHHIQ
jgi:hypothetical protein